ncbi:hypothetical protein [Luteimonas sp. gir]|uniref:hypothetical protein n=1 Tax=Luteimonas sp. gir TaxID=3127960 RepID=UPI003075B793
MKTARFFNISLVGLLCFSAPAISSADSALDGGIYFASPEAASCSFLDSRIFVGGFIQDMSCPGVGVVSGIGSTLNDAKSNAEQMGVLALETGVGCNAGAYWDIEFKTFPGGFRTRFFCSGAAAGAVGGIGSTATDLGHNLYQFAELFAATGTQCAFSTALPDLQAIPGGYYGTMFCDNGIRGTTLPGVGSATGFGVAVRRFAEGFALYDHACWFGFDAPNLTAIPGGWDFYVYCSSGDGAGVKISGFGSSMSDAGLNVADLAFQRASGG